VNIDGVCSMEDFEVLDRKFWDVILVKILSMEKVHCRGVQEKKEYYGVCN
jgi:hypothetical protein